MCKRERENMGRNIGGVQRGKRGVFVPGLSQFASFEQTLSICTADFERGWIILLERPESSFSLNKLPVAEKASGRRCSAIMVCEDQENEGRCYESKKGKENPIAKERT
jgi:hypothetical protein